MASVKLPDHQLHEINSAARRIVQETTLHPTTVSEEVAEALDELELAQYNYLRLVREGKIK